MIDELDEVLRKFLIREIPVKNGEVDIKFDMPKREWSARLNRPTLNLFLYDIRENTRLRQAQPMWEIERNKDQAVHRRNAVRLDLYYMITAWASEAEDEHRLLSRTLMAFFRHSHLPEDLLPESFQGQPVPIPLMAAQQNALQEPADVWSALDNELRPAIVAVLTLAMNPYHELTTSLVRTRELRIGPSPLPLWQQLERGTAPDLFWTIGGTLHSKKPLDLASVRLTLVEQGRAVTVQPDGRFTIGNLKAGDYTLEAAVDGGQPRRYKITVPSPDYDLEV